MRIIWAQLALEVVYTGLLYSTSLPLPPRSSSYPTLDDVHPVQTAQHAGRRLCAHVLSSRQRQVPSLAAAHESRVRGL